jgi:hypothetical protein
MGVAKEENGGFLVSTEGFEIIPIDLEMWSVE